MPDKISALGWIIAALLMGLLLGFVLEACVTVEHYAEVQKESMTCVYRERSYHMMEVKP